MKKDLLSNSAAVYMERRKNKSIWVKSCLIVALVVVVLTSYVLIFPARTVESELICGKQEHIHDASCYTQVLSCGLQDEPSHTHTSDCYTTMCVCGLDEHTHTEECYAVLQTLAPATDAPETEPAGTDAPATEEPAATEPAAADPEETEPAGTELAEPADTEPATEPAATEPAEPEPAETEPAEPAATEPVETEPDPAETAEPVETTGPAELRVPVLTFGLGQALESGDPIEFPDITEGVDLSDYLVSAIFQRQEDGAYIADTWFENGETVKAAISYDLPKDIVTPDSRFVYYQLPEGIEPIEETSGDVLDEGVPVGVYLIDTDGLIRILFNEDFANGNAILGTVEFTCGLYANEDESDRVIDFGNDAGTITITVPDTQKYDLVLKKTGAFNEDYSKASYVVTVSTAKGTGEPLSVIDEITIQTPATLFGAVYDRSSLVVRRVAADGTVSDCSDYSVDWLQEDMSFKLTGLPALAAGERYEVAYDVMLTPDLTGSFELDNEARAVSGVLEARTTFFINYVCDVTKTGIFNPNTGLIDWVIMINPESKPIAGWRVVDKLPYPAVGRVLLTNANGVVIFDITPIDGINIDYVFPDTLPARPYFIRYSTAAPTVTSVVVNKVQLINDHDITVISEVGVVERAEGVDKALDSMQVHPDGMVCTFWSFVVTMPIGEIDSYSFRDNISTPIMDLNDGDYLDINLHYGIPAEMEAAFRGNLRLIADGNSYYYGDEDNDYVDFELTYLDSQGRTLEPTDETSHAARILFKLTPHQGTTFHGYQIVCDSYPTWLDATQAETGAHWNYQNYLWLRDKLFDVVPAFYRKGNAFEKQVRGANGKFTSEDATVLYSECDGELAYRLVVDLTALAEDNVTVTDLLPAGVELVENEHSPRAFFAYESLHAEYDGTFAIGGNFSYTTEARPDGGTQVTFNATGITEQMKQEYDHVCIAYSVRLTDENVWNDYTHASRVFTNTANWGSYSDSQSTTVVNVPKRLEKNGVQLVDTDGNPTNRLRFAVLINAGAEDLNPEGDTVTLTDTFSTGIGSSFEFNSVRLYEYDPTRPDNIGNQVPTYDYTLVYSEAEKKMTVMLPDETAYVLVYDYTVDATAILNGQTAVENRAELTGGYHTSTSLKLQGVNSSASAWQCVITVIKVDDKNYGKVLPNTEFKLERWDAEHQEWVLKVDAEGMPTTYTTNLAGKFVLNLIGSDKDVENGVLYRLTETKPAPGYSGEGTVVWLICMPRASESREQVFAEAAAGSDAVFADTWFFGVNGGTCIVTNPFTGLTVQKRWFTADGCEMANPPYDSITVRLYVSTDKDGADPAPVPVEPSADVENPAVLKAEDNWTYTWDKLPTYNEDGQTLYYFIAEDDVPGYTPRYINNGITGGTIEIANDCEPYVLPSTGREGSGRFAALGILLMLTAAVVYIKIQRKKAKTQNL